MRLPVNNKATITSPYGNRILNEKEQFHDGIDWKNIENRDKSVLAVSKGKVVYDMDNYNEALRWVDNHHSGGNMLIVLHTIGEEKYYVRYLHLTENYVKVGDFVNEGQKLGIYGDVGYSFGAHLHNDFYEYPSWKKIDPTPIYKKAGLIKSD